MKSEKPLKLIELLQQFLAENDKINIGKIYIAIAEETNRIIFAETPTNPFSGLVYKHLIRLSIKDYIHSGHSEASVKVLEDVIEIISVAAIVSA